MNSRIYEKDYSEKDFIVNVKCYRPKTLKTQEDWESAQEEFWNFYLYDLLGKQRADNSGLVSNFRWYSKGRQDGYVCLSKRHFTWKQAKPLLIKIAKYVNSL